MAKKRSNGDWCFYHTKDKDWTVRKQFGYKENGKPNIVAFYGKTRAIVKEKAFKFDSSYDPGRESVKRKIKSLTFIQFMKDWIESSKRATVKQSYLDDIESIMKRISNYNFANTPLTAISYKICESLVSDLVRDERKYSLNTINKTIIVVSLALDYAVDNKYISKNYLNQVPRPSESNVQTKKKEISVFEKSDIDKIYSECNKGKYKYQYSEVIIILLNTGMRIGECLALQWKDIKLNEKSNKYEISISKTAQLIKSSSGNTNYIIKIDTPKTKSSYRKIPLNDMAYKAFEDIKKKNGKHIKPNDYVVLTNKFKQTTARNILRCFKSIIKNANCDIQEASLHTLRHTFATQLLNKGANIKVVSALLGHSKVETTYEIYISLLADNTLDAINLLND